MSYYCLLISLCVKSITFMHIILLKHFSTLPTLVFNTYCISRPSSGQLETYILWVTMQNCGQQLNNHLLHTYYVKSNETHLGYTKLNIVPIPQELTNPVVERSTYTLKLESALCKLKRICYRVINWNQKNSGETMCKILHEG